MSDLFTSNFDWVVRITGMFLIIILKQSWVLKQVNQFIYLTGEWCFKTFVLKIG